MATRPKSSSVLKKDKITDKDKDKNDKLARQKSSTKPMSDKDKEKIDKIARQKSTTEKLERHSVAVEKPVSPPATLESKSSSSYLKKVESVKVIPAPNWDSPSPRGHIETPGIGLPSSRAAQVAVQKKAAGLKKLQDLEREAAEKARIEAEAANNPTLNEPEEKEDPEDAGKKKDKPKPVRSKSSKHIKKLESREASNEKKRSTSSRDLPGPMTSSSSRAGLKSPKSTTDEKRSSRDSKNLTPKEEPLKEALDETPQENDTEEPPVDSTPKDSEEKPMPTPPAGPEDIGASDVVSTDEEEELRVTLAGLELRVANLQKENEHLHGQLRKEEAQIAQLSALLQTVDPNQTISPRAPRTKNDVELISILPAKRPITLLSSKPSHSEREKEILELIISEQDFSRNMTLVQQAYSIPLSTLVARVSSFKIKEGDVVAAFKGLDGLVNLVNNDKSLFALLEERLNQWQTDDNIGDIFLKYIPTAKPVYLLFANCYHESKKHQHKLKENVAFRKQVEEIDEHVRSHTGRDLEQLFKLPVDRLKVLGAALTRIQNDTPKEHPDYENLGAASELCQSIHAEALEKIESSTKNKAFSELIARGAGFERLAKEPAVTRAVLIKDEQTGAMEKEVVVRTLEYSARDIASIIDPKRHIKKKEAELLLFNDIIVASPFIQKRNSPQEYFLPLDMSYTQVFDLPTLKKKFPKVEISDEFSMVITGPESQWIVGFKNEDQRNEWVKLIKSNQTSDDPDGLQHGTYLFSGDKGTYEGDWFRAHPQGHGTLTVPATGKTFSGYWNSDFKCGFGEVSINGELIGPPCGWKDYGPNVDFIPRFWDSLTLTDNDWKLIMTGAEQVTRPNNTLLIEQGKRNAKLIRVKKGSIRVEREKGVTAAVLQAGAVVGDTAVITEIKEATVSVYTNEDNTELEEISVSLLFNLLRNNDVLCMRFFRDMSQKLSGQLRRLQVPAKDDEKKPVDKKDDAVMKPSGGIPKLQQLASSPAARFGLRDTESVAQSAPCVLKERFSKSGTLYLFQSIVIFEHDQNSFGLARTVTFPLNKIKKHKFDEKKEMLVIDKREFVGIPDVKQFHSVLVALMEEALQKGTSKKSHASKTELYGKKELPKEQSITLEPKDIELLLKGAIEKKYSSGEPIVVEGAKGQQRLYQVASGSCQVKKLIDGVETNIAVIPQGAMFGELSFVEEASNATASVLAGDGVTVHILEGWYINSLFVDNPPMAGKFYSYLCSVVAKRLTEREMELVKAQKK